MLQKSALDFLACNGGLSNEKEHGQSLIICHAGKKIMTAKSNAKPSPMTATKETLVAEYWLVIARGWGGHGPTEHRYPEARDKRPSLHVWETETHQYTATYNAPDGDGHLTKAVRPPGATRWSQLPEGEACPDFIKLRGSAIAWVRVRALRGR